MFELRCIYCAKTCLKSNFTNTIKARKSRWESKEAKHNRKAVQRVYKKPHNTNKKYSEAL